MQVDVPQLPPAEVHPPLFAAQVATETQLLFRHSKWGLLLGDVQVVGGVPQSGFVAHELATQVVDVL